MKNYRDIDTCPNGIFIRCKKKKRNVTRKMVDVELS